MAAKVLDGRYKLIKKLGAGGFGQTFIARDMRRPGTPPCVVKQLKPASDDPNFIREARRLFNTEAETLEKLGKHDQIPQLLAYFEEDQQFYLVQEFVDGKSLHDELTPKVEEPEDDDDDAETLIRMIESTEPSRSKLLSESEVVAILKDVLDILGFVHSEGVIHRDIKPDNLIRRKKDGKIVLIDFGAVKAFQEGAAIETSNGDSRFTVTIGTPGYMPNEQCAGRPNYSSDLYALGMVAIKALTGLSPTDLPTDVSTGELVWRDRARVNNGLAMVLTRMVRYQYTQRYQSAKEVLQGLTAFSISEETVSKTPTALVPIGKNGIGKQSSLTNYDPSAARPIASTSTRTVVKNNSQSNSGSGFLVAGLLAMVAITGMTIPLLMRQQKPAAVPTPAPTVVVEVTPNANPNADPLVKPTAVATTNNDPSNASQTLNLESGKESSVSGTLKANSSSSYLLNIKAGQKLKTELSGTGVALTVMDVNNAPLTNATNVTSFDGTLTTAGVYMIQIKPNIGVTQTNFILKATLSEEASIPVNVAPIQVKVDPKK